MQAEESHCDERDGAGSERSTCGTTQHVWCVSVCAHACTDNDGVYSQGHARGHHRCTYGEMAHCAFKANAHLDEVSSHEARAFCAGCC